MNFFPSSKSILSAEKILEFLEKKYVFLNGFNCKLIKSWVNDTYLITNDLDKYIFRVYRVGWRSEKEILAEIELVLKLRKKDISVSFPIPDLDDCFIQTFNAIEGNRIGVLFSFASGDKPKNSNEELEYSIGNYMAYLHQETEGMRLPRIEYTIETLLYEAIEKIGNYLNQESEEYLFLIKIKQYIYREIENVNLTSFRRGVIHFDLWKDNLHVDENKEITIFDFDFCGNGWLILDLAFHEIVTFITEPNIQKYESEINSFRKGYEDIFQIKKEEKDAIPLLAICALIYYLSFQSEKFAAIYANEDYIKLVINQRIKRWIKHCSLPISSVDIS